MTCYVYKNLIVCINQFHKLRIADGRHVWLEDTRMCGPVIWLDRQRSREHEFWYEDDQVVSAVNWFYKRGKRA